MISYLSEILILMGIGALVLLILFTITWLIQLKTGNAAIVDTVWSASFPLLTMLYFLLSNGLAMRKIVLLVMVCCWGFRLAVYLLFRTVGHPEDVRYTALRKEWGTQQHIFMLRFFYYQAIVALILSLPFALIVINASPGMKLPEWIGAGLWLVAVVGESTSDYQLKKFKSNPLNKGKVCQTGLWNYTRHPNYFFEWLVWVSYFIFSLGSPYGWMSVICPAFMLYVLLRVTGIPYTERQMAKSRGQAFIDYQQSTSPFVPLPKRRPSVRA